jgi:hypothetical protein
MTHNPDAFGVVMVLAVILVGWRLLTLHFVPGPHRPQWSHWRRDHAADVPITRIALERICTVQGCDAVDKKTPFEEKAIAILGEQGVPVDEKI